MESQKAGASYFQIASYREECHPHQAKAGGAGRLDGETPCLCAKDGDADQGPTLDLSLGDSAKRSDSEGVLLAHFSSNPSTPVVRSCSQDHDL